MKRSMKERVRTLLALGGIEIKPGERWDWRLTPRFFALAGGAMLVFVVANIGMIRYSESPNFCRSCHIMTPYYNAWKSSVHHGVACVECHYPPAGNITGIKKVLWKKYQNLSQVAKYVTRTYSSRPFAEVEDASCLRSGCHSKRLLEGKVSIKGGLVIFDHRPHLTETRRGRHLRCVSCHSQVVMGRHIEVTYETCWLCHFKGRGTGRDFKPIGGCTGCHGVPTGTFKIGNMTYDHKKFVTKRGVTCLNCHMNTVSGSGDAPKDRCFNCHNDPKLLARYPDVPFMHETHVTQHGVACFHCHTEMRHGFMEDRGVAARLDEPEPKDAAPALPESKPAVKFQCSLCHSGQHDAPLAMFSGTAARVFGLKDMPSPMFTAGVDCSGCHYKPKTPSTDPAGTTTLASPDACMKCHGPKFKGVFEETRDEVQASLANLSAKEAAAEKAVAVSKLPDAERARWSAALRKAVGQLAYLRAAQGEHNVYLAASALAAVNDELNAAGKAAGADLDDLSGDPLVSGSFCATLCHPKIGVKVPPATVRFEGKVMPHGMHAEQNGCRTCHLIGPHKKVPLRPNVRKTVCINCHG
ncbi:MAG: NapC/NirT family cytochrome c [Elusimicrobia bacterium]|nr:NapC/NirT family cytochrome c [Elusimicrobiota bacterium]